MTRSRTVFITGGTGSIGQSLVKTFAETGYRVIFQYRANDAAARSLSETTGAEAIRMDFMRLTPLDLGAADVLINNAGINICSQPTASVDDEAWAQTIAVNVTAPFRLIRSALPAMVARGWGRIVNISSTARLRTAENNLPYVVSKHALSALTKTVAKEYAAHGITSNEICPGPIESTLLQEMARRRTADDPSLTPERWLSSVRRALPAQRLGRPREVADLAVFLASDAAAYINGSTISLDGGFSA